MSAMEITTEDGQRSAFERIKAGLAQALAHARGEPVEGMRIHVYDLGEQVPGGVDGGTQV